MFEKLYSEETISKLKKIPLIVWYLFFGMASAFASLYALYMTGPEYISAANEIFSQHFANANMKGFLVMVYIMTIILDIVIFEIIAYFAYSILSRRFVTDLPMRDFVFRLRITMIIGYVIIGIVASIYFFLPSIQLITTAVVNTAVQNVLLAFFLFTICKNYISTGLSHKAYSYMARLYLTILIVFNLVNLVSLFMLDDSPTLMEYISFIIRLVLNLATILLAYYQYNKLKSIPPPDNTKIEQPPEDDVIFKDFDF